MPIGPTAAVGSWDQFFVKVEHVIHVSGLGLALSERCRANDVFGQSAAGYFLQVRAPDQRRLNSTCSRGAHRLLAFPTMVRKILLWGVFSPRPRSAMTLRPRRRCFVTIEASFVAQRTSSIAGQPRKSLWRDECMRRTDCVSRDKLVVNNLIGRVAAPGQHQTENRCIVHQTCRRDCRRVYRREYHEAGHLEEGRGRSQRTFCGISRSGMGRQPNAAVTEPPVALDGSRSWDGEVPIGLDPCGADPWCEFDRRFQTNRIRGVRDASGTGLGGELARGRGSCGSARRRCAACGAEESRRGARLRMLLLAMRCGRQTFRNGRPRAQTQYDAACNGGTCECRGPPACVVDARGDHATGAIRRRWLC